MFSLFSTQFWIYVLLYKVFMEFYAMSLNLNNRYFFNGVAPLKARGDETC